jgi:hypothetical protein
VLIRLGDGELDLDQRAVVERRDQRAGVHEASNADATQAGATAERRANDGVVETCLRSGDTRFIRSQSRLDLVHLRSRQHLGIGERPAAIVVGATLDHRSVGRGEVRLRLRWIELDEHRAALDELTFLEANGRHGVGSLRRDAHRFVGARRADRFDIDLHLPLRDGLRHHRHHIGTAACRAAARSTCRSLRSSVGARDQEETQNGENVLPAAHRTSRSSSSTKS